MIVGEVHGTQEIPRLILGLLPDLKKLGYNAIALEVDSDQREAITAWATQAGAQVPSFFANPNGDGRGNVQTLELLQAALSPDAAWKLICFDVTSIKAGYSWDMRDRQMARNLVSQRQKLCPNGKVIAICGNLHARLANHTTPDNWLHSFWPSFAAVLQQDNSAPHHQTRSTSCFHGGTTSTGARCSNFPTGLWKCHICGH